MDWFQDINNIVREELLAIYFYPLAVMGYRVSIKTSDFSEKSSNFKNGGDLDNLL